MGKSIVQKYLMLFSLNRNLYFYLKKIRKFYEQCYLKVKSLFERRYIIMDRINVVYSLITDDTKTKILMVKNIDNGQWSLPGSSVEENETFELAAIREAKEETGYDIKVHGIVAVNEAVLLKSNEHALLITFRAKVVGGSCEISRPDEISEIEWVNIEEADERMPYYKDGLKNIVNKRIEITYFDEGKVY